ncbi:tetratricopeptide repeat protein [Seonamhaeicola sediminis]|uniref:Tetratricopeptide repeat protein n=1 Tax=Seonamhaeicola sediminis TaxID=2528206 RepID=A0A562YJ68_9FLAO|nr:sensor histidine kinase [Seonamhaeicola sediminis]TWO34747.1 tetratricopeptide repeat protein [Seonamhaeicola sediminis]
MRRFFILIPLFLYLISVNAQDKNNNFELIDSIKVNVINSNVIDSTLIANAYYNIGELYRYSVKPDSAYYYYRKAEKFYRNRRDNYRLALTLYGIAVIQKNEKDYTGSELSSIEAISILNELNETENIIKYKSNIYNNLGLVFGQLGQFKESVEYFIKSLDFENRLTSQDKISTYMTKNNLALTYKKSGDYDLALDFFGEILSDKNLVNEFPALYVVVLDNYAHTLHLSNNNDEIPELYLKALKISDSIKPDSYSSIQINQHLAEYYHYKNNKDSSRYYAYKAREVAEKYSRDELLTSLLLLSKIEEGEKSVKHLREYVQLNDSLQKAERRIRNKFARIRFETEQIEQENKQIAKERMWLFIISVVVIMASFLLYLVVTQRNKNKELQFIQKQQETNEEIYNLMLSQNESIEEARTLEKKRISEELHDGVLGRLFGTRLSLDSLNFNNTPEAIKTRGQYIEELKSIEQDIRKVSHELNTDFVSGRGFIDIIKTLVETQTLAYKLEYNLTYDDSINWDDISNKKKIHVYRLIQETLHNIYKHAQATKVDISFKLKKDVICLTITDDGSGFDVNKAKSGIGLKNMNSRIKEIKGQLNITSEKDIGTKVVIEVPIP